MDIFSDISTFALGGVFGILLTVGGFMIITTLQEQAAEWRLWELQAWLEHIRHCGR